MMKKIIVVIASILLPLMTYAAAMSDGCTTACKISYDSCLKQAAGQKANTCSDTYVRCKNTCTKK